MRLNQCSNRTPSNGPPNSHLKFRNKRGGYTIRWYGKNGIAVIDIDIGQGDHHGVGMGKDQEVHWWDWDKESPRNDGPISSVPGHWGESVDSDGDIVVTPPDEVLNPPNFMLIPSGRPLPLRPSPVRPIVPLRIPVFP